VTVPVALDILRKVGTVGVSHGNLKLRFPEIARAELQATIDVLRNGKAEAIALLSKEGSRQSGVAVPDTGQCSAAEVFGDGPCNPERRQIPSDCDSQSELEALRLKGHAVELWRTGERYFIVADEDDANLATSCLGENVGEVWTDREIEIVARIEDQALREEVQRFKRKLNGRVRQIEKADGRER